MKPDLMLQIPAVEPDELAYLQSMTTNLPDDKLNQFIIIYSGKRRKPETILICCLLGFVLASGIHRFVIGQIGMGLLYFFTGGLCLIGTIVDAINYKQLTFEYNQRMAIETLGMIKNY